MAPGHGGAPVPALGTDTGVKRRGGNAFCLFSVLQITVNPARSALPPPPALPGPPCPAKEPALAGARCCLSPAGPCPCPQHSPTAGRAACPRVPSGAGGATCPHEGTRARPSRCCSRGPAAVPRGAGLTPRRSGGGVVPPTPSTGCQGGGQLSPGTPQTPLHPTNPARRGAAGLQGDSCDTPGCHTRPPPLPAVPGVPGQPWGPSVPLGTPLRATPSTGPRGAPSAWPARGGWGGRQAVISAGVN